MCRTLGFDKRQTGLLEVFGVHLGLSGSYDSNVGLLPTLLIHLGSRLFCQERIMELIAIKLFQYKERKMLWTLLLIFQVEAPG